MIDILRHKSFFPLKNFEDVERLLEFNLDKANGEPNLALLSIVFGLIEHSLVTVTDKVDLVSNSRPVTDRKKIFQNQTQHVRSSTDNAAAAGTSSISNSNTQNLNPSSVSSSSNHHPTSSTSNEISNRDETNQQQKYQPQHRESPDSSSTTDTSDESNIDSSKSSVDSSDSLGNSLQSNGAGDISSSDDRVSNNNSSNTTPDLTPRDNLVIPEIEFEIVETLYKKFVDQFKNIDDFKDIEAHKTNLKIKKISDSVWEHLSNSYYKDKAHLQSIFSYLTTSKLDCFGLAFAVIAGCQILNLKNIYLALSEDHAWVMFDQALDNDKNLTEYLSANLPIPTCAVHGTCEVTWHGKANSDKRGQPVTYKNCWLYVNGYAVKCDISMCVVALVNSINPTINTNTDSEVLALLQQRLLWLLYNHRSYFPMSLGNLGELEDICLTPGAPLKPLELFNLGVEISRTEYNDSHVYPYSYMASYFFKHGRFKEALETWADASSVITKYNYSRDDEEIYKEFFEVANDLLPSMLKVLTAGALEPGRVSKKPFLQDPECLALILKFYDNICVWEEGSSTPVLHTVWAKSFVATVLKFNPHIRSKIKMVAKDDSCNNKSVPRGDSRASEHCSSTSRYDNVDSVGTDSMQHELDGHDSETASCSKSTSSTTDAQIDLKRKRTYSPDDKGDSSERSILAKIKLESASNSSTVATSPKSSITISGDEADNVDKNDPQPDSQARAKRFEVDDDDNVTLVLRSSKIAGVRDLLQAERLNKNAIELQLTAQSQCVVRGRSNSSSYSSDFISTTLSSIGGSTRSKRLHR